MSKRPACTRDWPFVAIYVLLGPRLRLPASSAFFCAFHNISRAIRKHMRPTHAYITIQKNPFRSSHIPSHVGMRNGNDAGTVSLNNRSKCPTVKLFGGINTKSIFERVYVWVSVCVCSIVAKVAPARPVFRICFMRLQLNANLFNIRPRNDGGQFWMAWNDKEWASCLRHIV